MLHSSQAGGLLLLVGVVAALLGGGPSSSGSSAMAKGGHLKALNRCPSNSSSDFYANPMVTRPKGLTPTGVASPAVCTYPTLSKALGKANAHGPGARVIAAGGRTSKPAVFAKESFPLTPSPNVTLTTADDPTLGGGGLTPRRYQVKDKADGATPAVVLDEGAAMNGFTIRNARSAAGQHMVECAHGTIQMDGVVLDGQSVSGGALANGLHLSGDCSGAFAKVDVRNFAARGALISSSAGAASTFDQSSFESNGAGLRLDAGHAELTDTALDANRGDGLVVGTQAGPPGADLVLDGADSEVSENGGTGVVVNPSGNLTLTGPAVNSTNDPRLAIVSNGENGLLIRGAATASNFEVGPSRLQGVVIDTNRDVTIENFYLHGSGELPGSELAGQDGLLVRRTGDGLLTLGGERPTLASLSLISGNSGDGIHLGDAADPNDIHALIEDLDITGNQTGVFVEDQKTHSTQLDLHDVDVYCNAGNGAFINPAQVSFAQNKFHGNTLNQVVFDGGGGTYPSYSFTMDSPTGMCDAGANAVYDYTSKMVFGIFAQGNADVTVRHTEFEGGGTGLKDFAAQSGSQISVAQNCTAITIGGCGP